MVQIGTKLQGNEGLNSSLKAFRLSRGFIRPFRPAYIAITLEE